MKKRTLLILTASWMWLMGVQGDLGLAAIQPSYTLDYLPHENQSGFRSEEYESIAVQKLERGTRNFFLGWLEVPHQIKRQYYENKKAYKSVGIEPFFIGAFNGAFYGFGRTAVGFYEACTFPIVQGPIMEEIEDWYY